LELHVAGTDDLATAGGGGRLGRTLLLAFIRLYPSQLLSLLQVLEQFPLAAIAQAKAALGAVNEVFVLGFTSARSPCLLLVAFGAMPFSLDPEAEDYRWIEPVFRMGLPQTDGAV